MAPEVNCRLAFFRATVVWLSTIPLYLLSWLCLWYFYTCHHHWKKNKVLVGWQYDQKAQGLWNEKFKGFWVTEESLMKNEPQSDQNQVELQQILQCNDEVQ